MKIQHIEAAGNLLATYHSDLTYIRDFHRRKKGRVSESEYAGTLSDFLEEFRVARCVCKNGIAKLLALTLRWVDGLTPNDVDNFAKQLREEGLTYGKTMTVLASKLLFLNNPQTILPFDNYTKRAVGLKENIYAEYEFRLSNFRKQEIEEIKRNLTFIGDYLLVIESEFRDELQDIETVRENRYIDKLLWTMGRAMSYR